MTALPRRTLLLGALTLTATAPTQVRLETAAGTITIELALIQAPLSAGDFLACVRAGLWNGGAFTRTVSPANDHGHPPIAVIEATAKTGPPRRPIAHETTKQTGLRHRDGTVSLGRDAPGTASGTDFFICLGDQPGLDYGADRNKDHQGFAAFGQVVAGMDVVRLIHGAPTRPDSPDAYTRGQLLAPPIPIFTAQ